MKFKEFILSFCVIAASLPCAAIAQQGASGHITQLYAERGGSYMWVYLDTPLVNPGGCTATSGYYVVEFPTGSSRGPMVTLLTMAYLQRTAVTMWIQGCTTVQYQGYTRPMAADVYLNIFAN